LEDHQGTVRISIEVVVKRVVVQISQTKMRCKPDWTLCEEAEIISHRKTQFFW
jgi:hypothetical protein